MIIDVGMEEIMNFNQYFQAIVAARFIALARKGAINRAATT
jgi:hypothetical protein